MQQAMWRQSPDNVDRYNYIGTIMIYGTANRYEKKKIIKKKKYSLQYFSSNQTNTLNNEKYNYSRNIIETPYIHGNLVYIISIIPNPNT